MRAGPLAQARGSCGALDPGTRGGEGRSGQPDPAVPPPEARVGGSPTAPRRGGAGDPQAPRLGRPSAEGCRPDPEAARRTRLRVPRDRIPVLLDSRAPCHSPWPDCGSPPDGIRRSRPRPPHPRRPLRP